MAYYKLRFITQGSAGRERRGGALLANYIDDARTACGNTQVHSLVTKVRKKKSRTACGVPLGAFITPSCRVYCHSGSNWGALLPLSFCICMHPHHRADVRGKLFNITTKCEVICCEKETKFMWSTLLDEKNNGLLQEIITSWSLKTHTYECIWFIYLI